MFLNALDIGGHLSVTKCFPFFSECLDELAFLISKFGINVCQPTPAKAVKEIATQIADRDNSVRSASLNALVEAYNIVGDQLYKWLGRVSLIFFRNCDV